jgi:hypothetical protein
MLDERATAHVYRYVVKRRPDALLSKISLRLNVASGIVWRIATNCFDLVLIIPNDKESSVGRFFCCLGVS